MKRQVSPTRENPVLYENFSGRLQTGWHGTGKTHHVGEILLTIKFGIDAAHARCAAAFRRDELLFE